MSFVDFAGWYWILALVIWDENYLRGEDFHQARKEEPRITHDGIANY